MADENKFYDWNATFSRTEARIYFVCGPRGCGKTFGARVRAINDYIKKGKRFVEIMRNSSEADMISAGYFERIQERGYFKDWQFKTTNQAMYIAPLCNADETPDWEQIGYFVALSQFQRIKKTTFSNVGLMIFDEAVIDVKDRYHRYLKGEIEILANVVDSVTRENPGERNDAKLIMLGNACDVTCPYIEWLGIPEIPKFGYYWCRGKTALFHYVEPTNAEARERETLAGMMLEGTQEAKSAFKNKFDTDKDKEYIARKPSGAKFWAGIVYKNMRFGVWMDFNHCKVYINRKIPDGTKCIIALTDSDGRLDYTMATLKNDRLKILVNMYYEQMMRYDSIRTKAAFLQLLKFLGVKE